jgi:hypothetical protein
MFYTGKSLTLPTGYTTFELVFPCVLIGASNAVSSTLVYKLIQKQGNVILGMVLNLKRFLVIVLLLILIDG